MMAQPSRSALAVLLLLVVAVGATHYEKPPCGSDEVEAEIQGASGALCAPSCDAGAACPTDVPAGVTARPQCALKDASSGKQYCALLCTSDSQCDVKNGAVCSKVMVFVGVCTYPVKDAGVSGRPALAPAEPDMESPANAWPVPMVQGADLDKPALDQELVDALNAQEGSTWMAEVNVRFKGLTVKESLAQMGALLGGPIFGPRPEAEVAATAATSLPDAFDWREAMGDKCPSIKEVRDQSTCGSCWAFGSVEAMTDRICIKSNGTVQHELSAQDAVSCCGIMCGMGCNGGQPAGAWQYFKTFGIVSGGQYGDKTTCLPYAMPKCAHHVQDPKFAQCSGSQPTPSCARRCVDGESWRAAKVRNGQGSIYNVAGEAALRQEIFSHGPVTGMFMVFNDFLAYKSGVYQYTSGGLLGGHAIEIVGWGDENGVPYWWVKNSWNEDWGDHGFFKIVRGTNLVRKLRNGGIDSQVLNGGPVAGDVEVPRVEQLAVVV